jgi:hypothetical protein
MPGQNFPGGKNLQGISAQIGRFMGNFAGTAIAIAVRVLPA